METCLVKLRRVYGEHPHCWSIFSHYPSVLLSSVAASDITSTARVSSEYSPLSAIASVTSQVLALVTAPAQLCGRSLTARRMFQEKHLATRASTTTTSQLTSLKRKLWNKVKNHKNWKKKKNITEKNLSIFLSHIWGSSEMLGGESGE